MNNGVGRSVMRGLINHGPPTHITPGVGGVPLEDLSNVCSRMNYVTIQLTRIQLMRMNKATPMNKTTHMKVLQSFSIHALTRYGCAKLVQYISHSWLRVNDLFQRL